MLKPAVFLAQTSCRLALLGLVACTPLPSSSSLSPESPRPVKPLPAEAFIRSAETPSYHLSPPSPVPKSPTAGVKLSAAEVASQLQQAEDKAISAENLAQSAQSKEDWTLVIDQWNRAIARLPSLSSAGAQKATVQQKRAVYQSKLAEAQQKARTNPRQLVTGAPPTGGKGIPLMVAPLSPDGTTASPSPTASASPSSSPSPSPSPSPKPN